MASDNFDRADSGDLGANWTEGYSVVVGVSNMLGVSGNQAQAAVSVQCAAYYTALAFAANQRSECAINFTIHWEVGPSVRASGVDGSFVCYAAVVSNASGINVRYYQGTFGVTLLLSITGLTLVSGDRIALQVVGTLLTVFQNGVAIGSVNDSALASGSPGLYGESTSPSMDDWEGVEISAAAGVVTSWLPNYGSSGAKLAGMIPSGMTN